MKRHRIEQIYIFLPGVWWFEPRTEDPKSRLRFFIFMANVKFMVNYILNCSQIWQIRNFVLKNWTNITITFEFMVWYWGIVIKSLLWVEHVLQCSFNQNSSLLKIWRKEPKVTEPWNLSNRIEPSRIVFLSNHHTPTSYKFIYKIVHLLWPSSHCFDYW